MSARGTVDRGRLPRGSVGVRQGTAADAEFAADLDRRLRGGPHGPDLQYLLTDACRFVILRDCAYAVARGATPLFLSATNATDAADLLVAILATAEPDEVVDVNWMTATQQWAIRVAVDVGLELHPGGPVMTRGFSQLPAPYLASGAFG